MPQNFQMVGQARLQSILTTFFLGKSCTIISNNSIKESRFYGLKKQTIKQLPVQGSTLLTKKLKWFL